MNKKTRRKNEKDINFNVNDDDFNDRNFTICG